MNDELTELRFLTQKETPTDQDVKIVIKTKERVNANSSVGTHYDFIRAVFSQSAEVQRVYAKSISSGKGRISSAVSMMMNGAEDKDIIAELDGSAKKRKFTPTEKENIGAQVRSKNEKLESENKVLKEENRKLKAMIDSQHAVDELMIFLKNSVRIIGNLKKEREKSEIILRHLSVPAQRAMEILEIPASSLGGLDDLKKAYRQKAKKAHPDMGGTERQFNELKTAYDLLKELFA